MMEIIPYFFQNLMNGPILNGPTSRLFFLFYSNLLFSHYGLILVNLLLIIFIKPDICESNARKNFISGALVLSKGRKILIHLFKNGHFWANISVIFLSNSGEVTFFTNIVTSMFQRLHFNSFHRLNVKLYVYNE